VLVATEPAAHVAFMQNFAGVTPQRTGDGFSLTAPRGAIEVMTPAAFSHRFGLAAPDTSRGARLAAIRFSGGKAQVNAAVGAVLAFE
jgi:hypothetical protein